MTTPTKNSAPELLYLLHGEPEDLALAARTFRAADIAEALLSLAPDIAAKVLGALPFDLAVQVFDEPELAHQRAEIIRLVNDRAASELIEAMSADQRADLFRDLPEADRPRLLKTLDEDTRAALKNLLRYAPDTAGGIMTTEFVSVPADWTVEQILRHISAVGRAKETVYAIYITDPASGALQHVVSLRELMVAERSIPVAQASDRRTPLVVGASTDREEVARIIAKYNMLALPVVDEDRRVLGIVTVDDVIDTLVREETEDVQKFGGMEALDEPYPDDSLSHE